VGYPGAAVHHGDRVLLSIQRTPQVKYLIQYGLEICVVIAAQNWLLRAVAVLLMCLTTYMWLRRGDHIGR
jgi:hypothetical protein